MKTYEVKNVIPSEVVMRQTAPKAFFLHIEVRERMDGGWRVWYPDPAWIPCEPVCKLVHKHDYEMRWIESHYKPVDFEDALGWANSLCEGREVKVISYEPVGGRRRKKVLTDGG